MKRFPLIPDLISALLVLLFLYTSFSKLAAYGNFRYALLQSPLLKNYSAILAWLLPALEITLAVFLLIPSLRLKGLYGSLALLIIFTFYLLYMVLFTYDFPCSCGGVIRKMTWPQHIFFNLFFILLSVTGILLYKKHRESMKPTPP